MADETDDNPYAPPPLPGDAPRAHGLYRMFAALALCVVVIVLMVVAHGMVYRLPYHRRPDVFGTLALACIFWPILCAVVPKWLLAPVMLCPVFGIWLGLFYTGDMGSGDYIFAAQPPCCTGVWSILIGGCISAFRFRRELRR